MPIQLDQDAFARPGAPNGFNAHEPAGAVPALDREWLLTTGTGGYAASTVVGANTRAQHGLLVAWVAGVGRAVMLAKLEETLHPAGTSPVGPPTPLSTNLYPGTVHPRGFEHLCRFEQGPASVTFTYRAGGGALRKTVFCRRGHETTCVVYEADRPGMLEVRPMLACRPQHERRRKDPSVEPEVVACAGALSVRLTGDLPALSLAHNAARIEDGSFWYERLQYPVTTDRRVADHEDLLSPWGLWFEVGPGRPAIVVATAGSLEDVPLGDLREVTSWRREAEARVAALAENGVRHLHVRASDTIFRGAPAAGDDETLARLLAAADAYLVRSHGRPPSIVAGYPGFGERGRDALIALPGLTLVTGRFDEARAILTAYAGRVQNGLLPSRLPEAGGTPDYGSIDAPLWYIHAVGEYWRYTGDADTVRRTLLPACRAVVDGLVGGTDFGIKADTDGLLRGGAEGAALTWMDAALDGRPLTPRAGKPVEVQALWYNALRTLDWLHIDLNGKRRTQYAGQADICRASFLSHFWNYRTSCLHDLVQPGRADSRVRPNQILAASLPFTMLNPQQIRAVVDAVRRRLLTPVGLRTLAADEAGYVGFGAGRQGERAAAHQGAVWPWLLGPFVTAYLRAYGHNPAAEDDCREMLAALAAHLAGQGCLGQIGETFDGDPPHAPRGGFARAWSVAEPLRAIWEDLLGRRGQPMTGRPDQPARRRVSRRGRRR